MWYVRKRDINLGAEVLESGLSICVPVNASNAERWYHTAY